MKTSNGVINHPCERERHKALFQHIFYTRYRPVPTQTTRVIHTRSRLSPHSICVTCFNIIGSKGRPKADLYQEGGVKLLAGMNSLQCVDRYVLKKKGAQRGRMGTMLQTTKYRRLFFFFFFSPLPPQSRNALHYGTRPSSFDTMGGHYLPVNVCEDGLPCKLQPHTATPEHNKPQN